LKPPLPQAAFSSSSREGESFSGRAWRPGCRSTKASFPPADSSGFLLLAFLPTLVLALLFLLGTARLVQLSQQRVAMQSRLDTCALALVQERRKLARRLSEGNRILELTAAAVAMSRGLRILAGPAGQLLGALGERGLVTLNRSTALLQEQQLALAGAKEAWLAVCRRSPYSRSPAFCRVSPSLSTALRRKPAMFPDLKGPLVALQLPLARAHCWGAGGLETRIRLEGNSRLGTQGDYYER
jgi:hypothetical protein